MDTATSTVSRACAKPMKVIFPDMFLDWVAANLFFWDKESLGFLQTHYLIFTVCCSTSFTLCFLTSPSSAIIGNKHYMLKPWFITLRAQNAFVCLQDRFCTDILIEKPDTWLQCVVLSHWNRLPVNDWALLIKFYLQKKLSEWVISNTGHYLKINMLPF